MNTGWVYVGADGLRSWRHDADVTHVTDAGPSSLSRLVSTVKVSEPSDVSLKEKPLLLGIKEQFHTLHLLRKKRL